MKKVVGGIFGGVFLIVIVNFIIWLSVVSGLAWLAYTIITKPELVGNWVKVVFG